MRRVLILISISTIVLWIGAVLVAQQQPVVTQLPNESAPQQNENQKPEKKQKKKKEKAKEKEEDLGKPSQEKQDKVELPTPKPKPAAKQDADQPVLIQIPETPRPAAPAPQPQTVQKVDLGQKQEENAGDAINMDLPKISITTFNVVAPVLAVGYDGNPVNGLRPEQFHVFDNGVEQTARVDVSFQPISLVIGIQANSQVEHILPEVNKIGNLIAPLLMGDQGQAAVIAYDSRIRVLQDFTNDTDKISKAVKTIYPGSSSVRLVDSVEAGMRMLAHQPTNRRRIMLWIGETRDMGSEARGRETMIDLQLYNIMFFQVDMSRFIEMMTGPAKDPDRRALAQPPAAYYVPQNQVATPTTISQAYGPENEIQFMPLLMEVYRDAKAIIKTNPTRLFTGATGGKQFTFFKGSGLESAIEKIGEQLHSEYLISYNPNKEVMVGQGGYHEIKIEVSSPLVKKVQTRPGYWAAALAQ
jgi:VWFA-related protein